MQTSMLKESVEKRCVKKGAKGAPTAAQFKRAKQTAKR